MYLFSNFHLANFQQTIFIINNSTAPSLKNSEWIFSTNLSPVTSLFTSPKISTSCVSLAASTAFSFVSFICQCIVQSCGAQRLFRNNSSISMTSTITPPLSHADNLFIALHSNWLKLFLVILFNFLSSLDHLANPIYYVWNHLQRTSSTC